MLLALYILQNEVLFYNGHTLNLLLLETWFVVENLLYKADNALGVRQDVL